MNLHGLLDRKSIGTNGVPGAGRIHPFAESEFGQHFGNALFEFFAGLELHDGTCRNRHGSIGFVRIAPDLGPRLCDLKGPEIPQHDVIIGGQAGGNLFDEALHDAEYLLLG